MSKIRSAKPRIVKAKINDGWTGLTEVWGVLTPKSAQLHYFLKHGVGPTAFYTNNISTDFKILKKKTGDSNG